MMSAYQRGLALDVQIVPSKIKTIYDNSRRRVREARIGATDVLVGGNHFYHRGISVGAVSHTFVGELADGIVGVMLDVVHILLIVGGIVLVMNAL